MLMTIQHSLIYIKVSVEIILTSYYVCSRSDTLLVIAVRSDNNDS